MQQLIQLIIYVVIFAIVAYGLFWICQKFQLPQPVMWICGAILLIIVLIFVANQLGAGGDQGLKLFPSRR
jgi:phosphate starvation-inducible membrane PsiE